jgi:hypothetical protein
MLNQDELASLMVLKESVSDTEKEILEKVIEEESIPMDSQIAKFVKKIRKDPAFCELVYLISPVLLETVTPASGSESKLTPERLSALSPEYKALALESVSIIIAHNSKK